MSKEVHMVPVWFFIGVLLAVYGAIIFVVALVDFDQPSVAVLAQYHPDLFGGIFLLALGGFYSVRFRPGRRKKE